MQQQETIQHLIDLTDAYEQIAKLFSLPPLCKVHAASTLKTKEIFFLRPPITPNGTVSRPDLTKTLWAEVHKIVRGYGRTLFKDVQTEASKQPDNLPLAVISLLAKDMYEALVKTYKTGDAIESAYKKRMRASYPHDESIAQREWVYDKETYLDTPCVIRAHEELNDIMGARNVQLARYHKKFPDATNEQLSEAFDLAKKIAVYGFIANYGLFELSDKHLKEILKQEFRVGSKGALEHANISDQLNAAPYHVDAGLGEGELREKLAEHSRVVKLYDLVAAVIESYALKDHRRESFKSNVDNAVKILKVLGVDEAPKIKTGKELAAIIGACGLHEQRSDWTKAADEIHEAKTKDELQSLLGEESTGKILDEIGNLDTGRIPALKAAQDLLADARHRMEDFDIDIKPSLSGREQERKHERIPVAQR